MTCAQSLEIAGQQHDLSDLIPVVILNWNGEEDTLECLKSIKASVPAGFLPILVDNGSRPESLEKLKFGCRQIFRKCIFFARGELSRLDMTTRGELLADIDADSLVFIENGENLGFAKGSNVGVDFAEWMRSQWVMLLNNDTVVTPETFLELRRFLQDNPSFNVVTAQIRHRTPRTVVQNCGGKLTYFGSRKYKFANKKISHVPNCEYSIVTFVTGCALLYRVGVTGTLTEDFFFGEEDYEFSLRMKKRGMAMACAHRAVVYHKVGATIGRSSRPLGTIMVYYMNRLINTRNYYSRLRWQLTRTFAYFYLPLLLAKSGIDPRKCFSVIRRVESYIETHTGVGPAEFQAVVSIKE